MTSLSDPDREVGSETHQIAPGLDRFAVERYSRQALAVGSSAQAALLRGSVLVVGAGGLGCAAIPYLAGAGVQRIGIADPDLVEASNLHRQILHRENEEGSSKAASAARFVRELNSAVTLDIHEEAMEASNARALVEHYDVVIDASDNPRTRYLLNDACVLVGRPLVSGSAIGLEGQLTVYNHAGGPCYRCVYPLPLPAEASRACADSGVLGPVPGVIGCLQATEALKILMGFNATDSMDSLSGRMLMYDARSASFHRFKLAPRSPTCLVCGHNKVGPSITSMEESDAFCVSHSLRGVSGPGAPCAPLPKAPLGHNACSVEEYRQVRLSHRRHLLVDVRVRLQFDLCSLRDAINIPLECLAARLEELTELSEQREVPIYVICRRGIASRVAAQLLSQEGFGNVFDIMGGLNEWSRVVDRGFPFY